MASLIFRGSVEQNKQLAIAKEVLGMSKCAIIRDLIDQYLPALIEAKREMRNKNQEWYQNQLSMNEERIQ